MASPRKHGLLPPVQAILNDVTHMQLGYRIPRDKFMMWINMLKRQHHGNIKVFFQLGVLAVQFSKHQASFVSDQFLILAGVGLEPAKVGALLDPQAVETKVAALFVQKFQQSQGGPSAGMAVAPPRTRRSARRAPDEAVVLSSTEADSTDSGDEHDKTRVTPGAETAPDEGSVEPTLVYNSSRRGKNEATRLERTPLPRARRSKITRRGRKKDSSDS